MNSMPLPTMPALKPLPYYQSIANSSLPLPIHRLLPSMKWQCWPNRRNYPPAAQVWHRLLSATNQECSWPSTAKDLPLLSSFNVEGLVPRLELRRSCFHRSSTCHDQHEEHAEA